MDALTPHSLLTNALLLDALDGIGSIASRLADLYDRWKVASDHNEDVLLLATVLTDLGWWSGGLQGAISPETATGLNEVVSGDY